MIRPGKMRHVLTLQRVTRAPDQFGVEAEAWADLATMRAELVSEETTQEAGETAGTQGRRKMVFRVRAFGAVTVGDRVQWRGAALDLVGISGAELVQGVAMDLTCEGAA